MALLQAELTKKIALTHDVYELHYNLGEKTSFRAGQFITFILPGIGGRAYSILEFHEDTCVLVIKRWGREMGGRGGSIMLCDAVVGDSFKAVGPAGHFTLTDAVVSRLFLGTGTGLVPLYSHILAGLATAKQEKYQLVFGVRSKKDLYYLERFETLKIQYPQNFYYHLVVSQDSPEGLIHKGYVTDFLSEKVIGDFREYYICGAPAMIESSIKKLQELGVGDDQIFFEKYA